MASAVVLAAGKGKRMGEDINKVYLRLAGKFVIQYSIETFAQCGQVSEIVLVVNKTDSAHYEKAISDSKCSEQRVKVVEGGSRRQDSSLAGVRAATNEFVLIHDAARPNFSPGLVEELVSATEEYGSALPGISPVDTIRWNEDGWAGRTEDRDLLIKVQTPQCFNREELAEVLREALAKGKYFTDDAGAMIALRETHPKIVPGERGNLKLTTPDDISLIEHFLTANSGRSRDHVGVDGLS